MVISGLPPNDSPNVADETRERAIRAETRPHYLLDTGIIICYKCLISSAFVSVFFPGRARQAYKYTRSV